MRALPFELNCPATFWLNKSAPEGEQRRFAGIISTENPDRQAEVVLQKGLDFEPFLKYGWFNDNHSKKTSEVVGVPALVKSYKRGDLLPNGMTAETNLSWSEGFLVPNHKPADDLWGLAMTLEKSGLNRQLGFSLEGGIRKREGPGGKVVAKAVVRNVAITNCPVNPDTRFEALAKSMQLVADTPDDVLEAFIKGMTMGVATPGTAVATQGPKTGEGAGQVTTPQSLETGSSQNITDTDDEDEDDKKLNKAEAILWLYQRMPSVSAQTLGRIVDTTLQLKRKGLL